MDYPILVVVVIVEVISHPYHLVVLVWGCLTFQCHRTP